MSVETHSVSDTAPGVSFTDAALKHVLAYLDKQESTQGIRLSVKKTGCSGYSYVVDYVESPAEKDIVIELGSHYVVCIDKLSYPYLKGMEIDYVKEGLNNKFMFNNPNQTGQCGCGESFTIEK
jgi:iron-sulfur cluster assembly protein